MFLGNLLLSLVFASCVTSLSGYFLFVVGRKSYLSLGKRSYVTFVGLTILLSALFAYQILANNFQIEYVYNYSSSDLPFFLLLSTFWAGQVGTFVLWLLLAALVGLFIYKSDDPQVPVIIFYYMLGALFLCVLLAVRTPFKMLPYVPDEGSGLNPLLRNFWMIIHPPVVFLGYALMAVPFSYAMAALTKNEYRGWTEAVFPWALISSVVLGLGIFLGGYWAYETLGWGGYWGWDPVENASLVPWLVNLALLHGLVVERKYGQLRKSNLALASLGYLLVIYGTFLTRSGVLADFSVHSFTDLGMNLYLVIFLAGFLALVLAAFALRFRQIVPLKRADNPWSTDFLIAIGMAVTTLFALLMLVGTSLPLITKLPFFSAPASAGVDYYQRIALPVGVMIALLAGLTPFFRTANPTVSRVLKRSLPSTALALAATLASLSLGVSSTRHALLVFFASYTLSANAQVLVMSPRRLSRRMGGNLAHIGFGIILIGFLGSTVFTRSERAALKTGETKEVLGYWVSYLGMDSGSMHDESAVRLTVDRDGRELSADPKLYFDSYSNSTMREPFIKSFLLYDLYIAPERVDRKPPGEEAVIPKLQTDTLGGWEVTFHSFDMSAHGELASTEVGAVVSVVNGNDSAQVIPRLVVSRDGTREPVPVRLDSAGTLLTLDEVDPARGTARLRVSNENDAESEVVVVNVSIKPLTSLVWLGAVIILLGTLIAWYNRRCIAASGTVR